MTTRDAEEKNEPAENIASEITFRCKSCGKLKPLNEMRVVTRFFPLLVVCKDCEKDML